MKICPQMVPIAQYYIILSTFDQEKLYIGKIRSNFIPPTPKRSALGPQMRGVNWSHPDKFSDWPIFLAILLHFQLKSIPRFKFLQYISQNNHILCNFNNNITYNGGGVYLYKLIHSLYVSCVPIWHISLVTWISVVLSSIITWHKLI